MQRQSKRHIGVIEEEKLTFDALCWIRLLTIALLEGVCDWEGICWCGEMWKVRVMGLF
jgi:hypothetical protein